MKSSSIKLINTPQSETKQTIFSLEQCFINMAQTIFYCNQGISKENLSDQLKQRYCLWIRSFLSYSIKTNDLVSHFILVRFLLELKPWALADDELSLLIKNNLLDEQRNRLQENEQLINKLSSLNNSTNELTKSANKKQAMRLFLLGQQRLKSSSIIHLKKATENLEHALSYFKESSATPQQLQKCSLALLQVRILICIYSTDQQERTENLVKVKQLLTKLDKYYNSIHCGHIERQTFETTKDYANELIHNKTALLQGSSLLTPSCTQLIKAIQHNKINTILNYSPIVNSKENKEEKKHQKELAQLNQLTYKTILNEIFCQFRKAWLHIQLKQYSKAITLSQATQNDIMRFLTSQRINLIFCEAILTRINIILYLWLIEIDPSKNTQTIKQAVLFFEEYIGHYSRSLNLSSEIKEHGAPNHPLLEKIQKVELLILTSKIDDFKKNMTETVIACRSFKSLKEILFDKKSTLHKATSRMVQNALIFTLGEANELIVSEYRNPEIKVTLNTKHKIKLLEIQLFLITHTDLQKSSLNNVTKIMTFLENNLRLLLKVNPKEYRQKIYCVIEYLNPQRQQWEHYNKIFTELHKALKQQWKQKNESAPLDTKNIHATEKLKKDPALQTTELDLLMANSIFRNYGMIQHALFYCNEASIHKIDRDINTLIIDNLVTQCYNAEKDENLLLEGILTFILWQLEESNETKITGENYVSKFFLQKEEKLELLKKKTKNKEMQFKNRLPKQEQKQVGLSLTFAENKKRRAIIIKTIDVISRIKSTNKTKLESAIKDLKEALVYFLEMRSIIQQSLKFNSRTTNKFNKTDLEYSEYHVAWLQLIYVQANLLHLLLYANLKNFKFEISTMANILNQLNVDRLELKKEKEILTTVKRIIMEIKGAPENSLLDRQFNFFSNNANLVKVIKSFSVHEILNYNSVIINKTRNSNTINQLIKELKALKKKSQSTKSLINHLCLQFRKVWLQIQLNEFSSAKQGISVIIEQAKKTIDNNYLCFAAYQALLTRVILVSHLWLAELHLKLNNKDLYNSEIKASIHFFNESCKKYAQQPNLALELKHHSQKKHKHPLYKAIKEYIASLIELNSTQESTQSHSLTNQKKNLISIQPSKRKKKRKKNKRKPLTFPENQKRSLGHQKIIYSTTQLIDPSETPLQNSITVTSNLKTNTKTDRHQDNKQTSSAYIQVPGEIKHNSNTENNQLLSSEYLEPKSPTYSESSNTTISDDGGSTTSEDTQFSPTTSAIPAEANITSPPLTLAVSQATFQVSKASNPCNQPRDLSTHKWLLLSKHQLSLPSSVTRIANRLTAFCDEQKISPPEFFGGCLRSKKPRDYDIVIPNSSHKSSLVLFLEKKLGAKKCEYINNLFQIRIKIGAQIIKIDITIDQQTNPEKIPDFLCNSFRAKKVKESWYVFYNTKYFTDHSKASSHLNSKILEIPNHRLNQHFAKSPIRILRGIRFCVTEGYQFSANAKLLIADQKSCLMNFSLTDFSPERILSELRKLPTQTQDKTIQLMHELDLLRFIFPELTKTRQSENLDPSQTVLRKVNIARKCCPRLTLAELYQLYIADAWFILDITNNNLPTINFNHTALAQSLTFKGGPYAILDALAICLKHQLKLSLDLLQRQLSQLPKQTFTANQVPQNWGRIKHFLKSLLFNPRSGFKVDDLMEKNGILTLFFPGACQQMRNNNYYREFISKQLKIASCEVTAQLPGRRLSIGLLMSYFLVGELLAWSIENPMLSIKLTNNEWKKDSTAVRTFLEKSFKNMPFRQMQDHHVNDILHLLNKFKRQNLAFPHFFRSSFTHSAQPTIAPPPFSYNQRLTHT